MSEGPPAFTPTFTNPLQQEAMQLIVGINENLEKAKQLSVQLNRGNGGRETSLAITKLQEAQHWLAEVLSELDTEKV